MEPLFTIGTGKGQVATFGNGVQKHKDEIKEKLGIEGNVSLWGEKGLATRYAEFLDKQNPGKTNIAQFEDADGTPSAVHSTIPKGTVVPPELIEHAKKSEETTPTLPAAPAAPPEPPASPAAEPSRWEKVKEFGANALEIATNTVSSTWNSLFGKKEN